MDRCFNELGCALKSRSTSLSVVDNAESLQCFKERTLPTFQGGPTKIRVEIDIPMAIRIM
ncbi:hypothetical protein TorRG33x02_153130 [Trema orientale]|uniref:Uncharacterized protein n=1 Tax=Trema orientale TaxID=63057 RepID=A0A2P5ETQ6_TREOI|nr:hypothetical protein TorRG33x02_153130 [Trema orientale]